MASHVLWYMYAQVNADRRTWIENSNGEFSLKRVELNHVGKSITTKAIGSMEGSDITHLYKFPEGSHEERTALGTNVIVGDLESKLAYWIIPQTRMMQLRLPEENIRFLARIIFLLSHTLAVQFTCKLCHVSKIGMSDTFPSSLYPLHPCY